MMWNQTPTPNQPMVGRGTLMSVLETEGVARATRLRDNERYRSDYSSNSRPLRS